MLLAGGDELVEIVGGWRRWLEHERRLAIRSVVAYESDLVSFLAFLAEHIGGQPTMASLRTLRAQDFRAWLAWRHHRELAKSSTARAMAAIRSLYAYLDRRHEIHNPALKAMRTPRFNRPLPRPLSPGQALELTEEIAGGARDAWIGKRDTAVLLLLYGAGLRIGEALSLDRCDVGVDALHLKGLRVVGKGGRERVVPVLPVVAEGLADYLAACPLPIEPRSPLFSVHVAGDFILQSFKRRFAICARFWDCQKRRRRMHCAILSRPTFSRPAPTCV